MRILLIYLLPFFISCGNRVTTGRVSENHLRSTLAEGLSQPIDMMITPQIVKPGTRTLKLTLTNTTQESIEFGASYSIERLNNGRWAEVFDPGQIAVISIMYSLAPGESGKYDIALYPDRFSYPPGTYQVKKNILVNGENHPVHVRFLVK